MSEGRGSRVGRFVIVAALMIATLGFGLAGLCGAVFTAIGLPAAFAGGPENYSSAMLIISVPSLLIGGGLALWCGILLARRWRDDA